MNKRIRNFSFCVWLLSAGLITVGVIMLYVSHGTKFTGAFLVALSWLGLSITMAHYSLYTQEIVSEKMLVKLSEAKINFLKRLGAIASFLFFSIFCNSAVALMAHYEIVPLKALDHAEMIMKYLFIAIVCAFLVNIGVLFLKKNVK